MNSVHVHAPPATGYGISAGDCLDCKRRSRFIWFAYEWYGPEQTCLRCGRHWSDGEWMPLPFMRGAREKSIEHAKKQWRKYRATEGSGR